VNRLFVMGALVLAAGCASMGPLEATGILGDKPSYLEAVTENVPNRQAIVRRIWTPGLDEGWVPQGLTIADRFVLVAAYHPMPDLKSNTGPCRVFRLERSSGLAAGHFDMPVGACTHAGGLAYLGGGKLLLADTRQIFLVDLDRALATQRAEGAMKSLKLGGELRGSYAGFDGRDPWIGTWTKKEVEAHMYRLPVRLFDEHDGGSIDNRQAAEVRPVPLEVQGAAFDAQGRVWVSASNSHWGKLYRLDVNGHAEAEWPMTAGLEDLAFDSDGLLWGVSESGTRKYIGWETKFPFVMAIDVTRLVK
jgi:hypothetical protein